jgi:hypothetical protein
MTYPAQKTGVFAKILLGNGGIRMLGKQIIAGATGFVSNPFLGNPLTAAGSTKADALVLTNQINVIGTAAANTGVLLPLGVVGQPITIYNNGANAIKVYGSGSDTIDGAAAATGVTLTNAKRCEYLCIAAGVYISAQLGAVSA